MIQRQKSGLTKRVTDLNILLEFFQLILINTENLAGERILQIGDVLSTIKGNLNETCLMIKNFQLNAISNLKDDVQLQCRVSLAVELVNFLHFIQNIVIK